MSSARLSSNEMPSPRLPTTGSSSRRARGMTPDRSPSPSKQAGGWKAKPVSAFSTCQPTTFFAASEAFLGHAHRTRRRVPHVASRDPPPITAVRIQRAGLPGCARSGELVQEERDREREDDERLGTPCRGHGRRMSPPAARLRAMPSARCRRAYPGPCRFERRENDRETGAESGTEADATVLRERGRRGEQRRRSGGMVLSLRSSSSSEGSGSRGTESVRVSCSASCAYSTDTAMYTVEGARTRAPGSRRRTGQAEEHDKGASPAASTSHSGTDLMIPNTRWSPNIFAVSRSVSANGRAEHRQELDRRIRGTRRDRACAEEVDAVHHTGRGEHEKDD